MKSFRIPLDRCTNVVTRLACGCLAVLVVVSSAMGQAEDKSGREEGTPSIEEKTESMDRIDGFVPLYWDAAKGRLWMEIARFDTEFLL